MKKDSLCQGIKEPLFAAANSGRGFVSFYDDIFGREDIVRRYIIKGGPGTGKSSFMKRVADFAEKKRKNVEYYRCSSDHTSLDGIIIDGRIALIDGTAPHSVDLELAGARDEIINLGEFWNSMALYQNLDEIKALSEKKSGAYKKAYRYLDACLNIENINASLLVPCIMSDKLKRAAERIVRSIPKGKEGRVLAGIEGSMGMRGSFRFDSYIKEAEKIYIIQDYYDSAHVFLAEVAEEGLKNHNLMRISYDHVSASRPDAVYFNESKTCFAILDKIDITNVKNEEKINMKRFIDASRLKEIKGEIRSNFKIGNVLLATSAESMKTAGEYHFLLEEIYKNCMDFDALGEFCKDFCKKLTEYF